MAGADEPQDFESLMAEVERTLGGKANPTPVVPRQGGTRKPPEKVPLGSRMRTAGLTAAASAVIVWLLFAILPFLRAGSGAAGAFLATFVAVLLLRRR